MPRLPTELMHTISVVLDDTAVQTTITTPDRFSQRHELAKQLSKRVNLPPFNASTAPSGLLQAVTQDPWSESDKYARGWLYFCVILLASAMAARLYHFWSDKIRTAQYKGKNADSPIYLESPETPYEMYNLYSDRSTNKLFPRGNGMQLPPDQLQQESSLSSARPVHVLMACFRYVFYRPTPVIRLHKKWRPISFPTLAVLAVSFAALAFSVLYCFLPKPLYWPSIAYGSPPLAIRAGMISVAMMPWLVALSMKTNLITFLTGIGHERLNVLHRWGGWLCLFLALVHTVPFYVMPVWDKGGYQVFRSFFQKGVYVYGTGEIIKRYLRSLRRLT